MPKEENATKCPVTAAKLLLNPPNGFLFLGALAFPIGRDPHQEIKSTLQVTL